MKIIDISTDAFTAPNYADDPQPKFKWLKSISDGDEYNLSLMGMTPHSGTHIDAPYHYLENGCKVDEIDPALCYGSCTVVTLTGVLTGEDMDKLLPHCRKRLLIHGSGNASLELSAARVLTENGTKLVGIDAVSVSFDDQEESVHRELLSHDVVILENIDLTNVPDGDYILCAMPLKLGGMEAAPVRAILITK